jgi:hypothetical protein
LGACGEKLVAVEHDAIGALPHIAEGLLAEIRDLLKEK